MAGLFIDPTSIQRATSTESKPKALEKAAEQFEAMLLKEITKHAVPKSVDGESSMGTDTWGDMLAHELAGAMASSGALGLSKLVTRGMSGAGASQPANHDHRVTSGYGVRLHPITGQHGFHHGVDVSVPVGTPLTAPIDGVVERIDEGGHGGLSLTISHRGGRSTTFRHLSATVPSVGDRVRAGEIVAESGDSGRTTGPHLHLEMRDHGRTIDPAQYVNRVFVSRKAQEASE